MERASAAGPAPITPSLIAIDWGTSRLRAYLLGPGGEVLEGRASEAGLLGMAGRDYPTVLREAIGEWLGASPRLPVIASGMVGSRHGWREVDYLPCPADGASLAAALAEVPFGETRVMIVPGLRYEAGSAADVMRGEETQVLGAFRGDPAPSQCVVLPGTHSKWVRTESGRIVEFATYPTGELFALLRDRSTLGQLALGNAEDWDAFDRGVDEGAAGGGLLGSLFRVRSYALLGREAPAGLAAYLSGLLIGYEVREALAASAHAGRGEVESLTLVAGSALDERYRRALARRGIVVESAAPDAGARGLYAVAVRAGLIGGDV